ncbi:hypothetical protein FB440_104108 [Vibrio crassostreae]|nr:hypothetical protein [Vibrio crassostreae]TWD40945.1 hypothetical protein FB440_104108 [Vibrio crassostreae]
MAKVFWFSRSEFDYWVYNCNNVTQRNEHRKQFGSKVHQVFDDKKERDGVSRIQIKL